MTKTEKLSHYAVVVIALTAVAISIWQGQLSKKQLEISIRHNKLTVKPYLDVERFTDSDKGVLEIRLSNQGYGPAIVKSWELWNDGKKYDYWNAVLAEVGESKNIRYLRNYTENSVIAANSEDLLCRLETSAYPAKGITLKIIYESIYEEKDSIEFSF